jgi:2-polyprenyl-3-methyl-5-hydroxy-6-metoxy-1,4-benzoquinol methylase
MQKNTPELWDSLWKQTSFDEDVYNLVKEEKGIRWQRIENLIHKRFGSFKNLKVIEIGAGAGTNAILFAKRGSKITILDYSKKALERSKEFFKRNNLEANFILADVLNLPKNQLNQFDVSMSFGLAEHFISHEREKVIKSHVDLLKTSGVSIISVPNKYNFPYRFFMFVSKSLGKWKFGEEYPYSISEMKKICNSLKYADFDFFGDSFLSSFRFINIFKLFKNKKTHPIKKEKGFWIDKYLAYSLVLMIFPPTKT